LGSNPSELPFVSVVVTVRNEERHIGQLLESLLAQEGPFEVVLVDAESRDRTVAIAEAVGARAPGVLRIIRRPGSRGIGRNVGVRASRGPWVAFIDGDCFADSQWLHQLRTRFAPGTVIAGKTVIVGKPRYGELERVELFQGGYDVTYPSCNLVYERGAFVRMGGFDPRFITAEDIDLNLRAVQAGASIVYEPRAVVYHHMRGTFFRFLYQAFWNGYGRKQLTEKHGNLWGRYRMRRLIEGQRGAIASARLAAAFGGYVTRMLMGGDSRLSADAPEGLAE